MKKSKSFFFFLILITLTSCGGDKLLVPKPPTYLRLDFPKQSYRAVNSNCGFSFELSKVYSLSEGNTTGNVCYQEIDLGKVNGKLFLYHYQLQPSDTLSKFINFSNDKVDDHKLKATSIDDEKIIRKKDNVYGTFFFLKGAVATNYQFYLTDSTNHFLRAELLLNCTPNFDSLKPTLDYIHTDLKKMISTLKWK